MPRAPEVLAATRVPPVEGLLQGELTLSQVEAATPVCRSLPEVDAALRQLRGRVGDAARAVGCSLASTGTAPLGGWRGQQVSGDPAYAGLRDRGRQIVREQQIAGLHVHIGAPERDSADPGWRPAVLDRVRPWLPLLLALAASSPWWDGADTGFASWRWVHWRRWPASGAPPVCGDLDGYDRAVAALVSAGVIDGPRTVYWDARLSARFPTVEIRVCDALPTVGEALALAACARALVAAALADHDARRPVPEVAPFVLDAAGWRAARWGLSGDLMDPRAGDGRLIAAADAVQALVEHTGPALDAAARRHLQGWSSPAQRQRDAGTAAGAAALVVDETMRGVPRGAVVRPAGARPDDADERRLRAERPPHHG